MSRRSERWLRYIQTLKIRARDRRIIPFQLNEPQRRVWDLIAPKIDRHEAIRLIILKARREGISTLIEALMMAMIAEGDNVNALVTAHQSKAAKKILQMSKLFVSTNPLLHRLAVPGTASITIGRSTLDISTAGSPESERGGDLTAVHLSEAAFYPRPEVMTATMQALVDDPDIFSIGVIESTANGKVGEGELFYDEWIRAEEGESGWTPIFLPWFEFTEYRLPTDELEGLDAEEQELQSRFHLDEEQLAWRRAKIARDLRGDVNLFHQEYPSFPEEAFISTGLPFFRTEHLLPFGQHLREGIKGTVTVEGTFEPQKQGYLEVYRRPQPGHTYVIGGDSSMGIADDEGKKKTHSRSAAEVIDMETMEQVAEYDAASAPHLMARHLVGMARFYNGALIAPEVQSSGGGGGREIIVYIRDLSYWNLHQWKGQIEKIQQEASILYGWECPAVSSRVLTADLRWIRAGDVTVGTRLLGCRETATGGRGSAHRLAIQTVTEARLFHAPILRVTLTNGQQTEVSSTHPFLVLRGSPPWHWRRADQVRPGDFVKYIPPWDTLDTYQAGRLSAFLDGEGHLSRAARAGGYQLLISQAVGELADEIAALWGDLGFLAPFKWVRHKKRPHEKALMQVGVLRLPDVLRALGSLRPTRLLRRFAEFTEREWFTLRAFPRAVIQSVEAIGTGPVIGLTTDPDHTLIADGIVGHNTNSRTRPRMLARIREVVMERSAIIHSRRLYKQLSDFGENDSGNLAALAGRDDLIFAWGIAIMSRSENYYRINPQPEDPRIEMDWKAHGIHVRKEEHPMDRVRRLLAMPDDTETAKTFLEL